MVMFPFNLFKKNDGDGLDPAVKRAAGVGVAVMERPAPPMVASPMASAAEAPHVTAPAQSTSGAGATASAPTAATGSEAGPAAGGNVDTLLAAPQAAEEEKEVDAKNGADLDSVLNVFKEEETIDPTLKARAERVEHVEIDVLANLGREIRMIMSRRAA
jgi:hypothetical protein